MTTFQRVLVWSGLPFAIASGYLGVRLTIEKTLWTWDNGLQMVGFSLAHGLGILLFPVMLLGFIWAGSYIVYAVWWRFSGGIVGITFLLVFIAGVILMNLPYSFWQHAFIDKLVDNLRSYQFLESAIYYNDIEMVKSMLAKGVSVNIRDRRGSTPLFAAVRSEKIKIVKYLIENGADVNAVNDEGDSALYIAEASAESAELKGEAFALFTEIVVYLKKSGAVSHIGSQEQREKVNKRIICEDIKEMDKRAVLDGLINLPPDMWGCVPE